MMDLISRIVRYLRTGSSRFVPSTEIAVVLFKLKPGDNIKGPKEHVQRAIRTNMKALEARGVEIEASARGYRIKK